MTHRLSTTALVLSCAITTLNAFAAAKDTSKDQNVLFELSGGTSQLDQNMANDNLEHPIAGLIAGRLRKSIFHLGVTALGLYHTDTASANPAGQAPNPNESDAIESFTLTTLSAGLLLGDFLLLNAGYGYATFMRSDSTPYATPNASKSYKATGTGWLFGGSIIPIQMGKVGIGATGYYFDATASDYSSDSISGTTETLKGSGNGSVHSFGWYTGLSIFIGL